MKVLFLTKYSRQGASSRMRSFQYFPFLEQNGVEVTCRPLFGDEYLYNLYHGTGTKKLVLMAYLRRFLLLFTVFRYDMVVIEKELFPYFPAVFERIWAAFGIKYTADYDDAIFHNYDQHPNGLFRWLLKDKIDQVMKHSHAVVAGNSYLAERARLAGARKVHILPTVVDLSRYSIKQAEVHQPLIVGWIGTPSTFEKHFSTLKNVIKTAAQEIAVEFHVIGLPVQPGYAEQVKFLPWSEDTEVASIAAFDIGIMPLLDSAWERGKCSYKLIQYMACGIPVIASPVGMNTEVVQENITGFLALQDWEWLSKLKMLVLDESLRKNIGIAGRRLVEERYCLEKTQVTILKILSNDI